MIGINKSQVQISKTQDKKRLRILAMGVFDLFHVGHLRYLKQAKAMGCHLTVGVATDAISMASKGKCPVVPEAQRLEIVSALACVDVARLLPSTTMDTVSALAWMAEWQIDMVLVGANWAGSERWNRLTPLLAERGVAVSFAPETPGTSTSALIQSIRQHA